MNTIDIFDITFNGLTHSFEEHECRAGRDNGCDTCQWYLDQVQDLVDSLKESDAKFTEKLYRIHRIEAIVSGLFKAHFLDLSM